MVDSCSEVPPQSQSRQRLFRQPPLRLNWPNPLPQQQQPHRTKRRPRNDESSKTVPTVMKRSRSLPLPLVSSTMKSISTDGECKNSNNINDLWTVRHTPQISTDLVVATKKVQEIQQWMKGHTNVNRQPVVISKERMTPSTTGAQNNYATPPMLILVGSPGIGKSTTIRCLANELEFELSEWTDSFTTSSSGSGYGNNKNIQLSNALDSFDKFLQQCGSVILPLSMQAPVVAATPTARIVKMTQAKEPLGALTDPSEAKVKLLLCMTEIKCWRFGGREWQPKKNCLEDGKVARKVWKMLQLV